MSSWSILSCISHEQKYCSGRISISVDSFYCEDQAMIEEHKIRNGCTSLQLGEKETRLILKAG